LAPIIFAGRGRSVKNKKDNNNNVIFGGGVYGKKVNEESNYISVD
jgi:hypothetical protein